MPTGKKHFKGYLDLKLGDTVFIADENRHWIKTKVDRVRHPGPRGQILVGDLKFSHTSGFALRGYTKRSGCTIYLDTPENRAHFEKQERLEQTIALQEQICIMIYKMELEDLLETKKFIELDL